MEVDSQQREVERRESTGEGGQLSLLVPICVNLRQERADDGTCSKWALECIAWSLVDASTGRLLHRRNVDLANVVATNSNGDDDEDDKLQDLSEAQADNATENTPKQQHASSAAMLAEAIKQIDESVQPYGGADKCLLVTCGPLHLRQHLHPAAMRAEVQLSGLYDRYVDLPKEFQRTYQGFMVRAAESGSGSSARPNFGSVVGPALGSRLNEASSAGSSAASCASSRGSAGSQYQSGNMFQDMCYCWCCYFCDYYPQPGACSPTSDAAQYDQVPTAFHRQQEQQFYSSAQQQVVTTTATTTTKHKQQVAPTSTRRQAAGQQSVGQAANHHNQRQLRQLEEMFKFLSIESQPATGDWQATEADEEEVTRCEKCHLAAEQKLAELRQPRTDHAAAAAAGDRDQGGQDYKKDNDFHRDEQAETLTAAATCSQATGADDETSSPEANDKPPADDDADGKTTPPTRTKKKSSSSSPPPPPPAHCLACSSLASAKLVDSMSLVIEHMLKEGHQFVRFERIKRVVEVGLSDSNANDTEHRVVRARGLPWQATEQEIANFFIGLNIARGGVSLCLSRQGRRNGEALIQFESREHRNLALGRHKHFMGPRYIEVYRASGEDFTSLASGYNNKTEAFLSRGAQVIVRMRGLPFTCTSKQVVDFFSGATNNGGDRRCEVLGQEEGVLFVKNQDDKPTGDAFVLFASEEFAQRALQKHKQNIGPRYVELFRSSISEVQQVLSISKEISGGANNLLNTHQHNQQQAKAATTNVPMTSANKSAPECSETNNKSCQLRQAAGQFTYAQAATPSFAMVAAAAVVGSNPARPAERPSCQVELAESSKVVSGGSSTSSAFDSNSLNSESVVNSDELATASGSEEGTVPYLLTTETATTARAGEDQAASAANQQLAAASDQLLSSTAQSPISSLSAASTGSSSYRSLHNSNGQRGHNQRAYNAGSYTNNSYHARNSHYHHHNTFHHQQQHHHHSHQLQHQQFAPQMGAHHFGAAGHYAPIGGHQSHLLPGALANHRMAPGAHQNHPHSYHPAAYPYPPHLAAAYPMPPFHHHHHHPSQLHMAAAMAARGDALTASGHYCYDQSGRRADCVRLHGLPFEAQVEDVLYFLGEHSKDIVFQGVHMVYNAQGQPSGESIVQMSSAAAAAAVAQEFHKKVMTVGKKQRYVEVITCSADDLHLMLGVGFMQPPPHLHHHQAAAAPLPIPPQVATSAHYLNIDAHQSAAETPAQATDEDGAGEQAKKQPETIELAAPTGGTAEDEPKEEEMTCDDDDGDADDDEPAQKTTTTLVHAPTAPGAAAADHSQTAAAAAAAAFMPATYYPILYYYPQHPQMLAAPPYH